MSVPNDARPPSRSHTPCRTAVQLAVSAFLLVGIPLILAVTIPTHPFAFVVAYVVGLFARPPLARWLMRLDRWANGTTWQVTPSEWPARIRAVRAAVADWLDPET